MCVCNSEWGSWEWRVLMELDRYVIRNEMRQICSSPVLSRAIIHIQTNSHIHTHTHSASRQACPECRRDNLMNLPSSMCAHLLVQPLVPTSITTTLLVVVVGGLGMCVWVMNKRVQCSSDKKPSRTMLWCSVRQLVIQTPVTWSYSLWYVSKMPATE